VPLCFQVVQKVEDQLGIKLHDTQPIDGKAANARSVLEQQAQGVAIASQRARTASSRQLEIVYEERLDRIKEWIRGLHGSTTSNPTLRRNRREAVDSVWGVAER